MNRKIVAIAAVIILAAGGAGYYFFVFNNGHEPTDADYKGSLVETYEVAIDANKAYVTGIEPTSDSFRAVTSDADYRNKVWDIIREKQTEADAAKNSTNDQIKSEYAEIERLSAASGRTAQENPGMEWSTLERLEKGNGQPLECELAYFTRMLYYVQDEYKVEHSYYLANLSYLDRIPQSLIDLFAKYGLENDYDKDDAILQYVGYVSIDLITGDYHFHNPELMPEGTSEEFYKELRDLYKTGDNEESISSIRADIFNNKNYRSYREGTSLMGEIDRAIDNILGKLAPEYGVQIREHVDKIGELRDAYDDQVNSIQKNAESKVAELQKQYLSL